MKKQFWDIRGYDSNKKICQKYVSKGQLTPNQVQNVLQALAAQSLDLDEIVGAYARRKSTIENSLLIVQKFDRGTVYACGENPCFTARIVDESYKPVKLSHLLNNNP